MDIFKHAFFGALHMSIERRTKLNPTMSTLTLSVGNKTCRETHICSPILAQRSH